MRRLNSVIKCLIKLRNYIFTFLFAFIFCFSFFWIHSQYNHVWEAVLGNCPHSAGTTGVKTNGSLYLLKQTHEPLFRLDDGENYSSRLLKKWSRSVDSRYYEFCPDTTIRFDSSHRLTFDFFEKYIRKITKKFNADSTISVFGKCVSVSFPNPQKSYFSYLSDYYNSPTLYKTKNIEIGLGPYYVKSVTKNKILLVRKKPIFHGYNEIILHQYNGLDDSLLQNRNIAVI